MGYLSLSGTRVTPTHETHYWHPPADGKPGYWTRRPSTTKPRATVTQTDSNRRICQQDFPKHLGDQAECLRLLDSGISLKAMRFRLALKAARRGPAVEREHRLGPLTAECVNAGVPEAYLELCIAARQQGYDIGTSAGAALEQAAIAARKRRNLILMAGGGAALIVGLFVFKKKRKKKGGK